MGIPLLSLTEQQALVSMRNFLQAVLPEGTPVVRGQTNRVPEPPETNFVTMIPGSRERLETNVNTYSDGYPTGPSQFTALVPTKVTMKLSVHGPQSADNSQFIVTLLRSDWGVQQFQATGYDVTPLYTSDPIQMPFENGEQQIEKRWMVDAVLQVNPLVVVPQQFMDSISVILIDVDVFDFGLTNTAAADYAHADYAQADVPYPGTPIT